MHGAEYTEVLYISLLLKVVGQYIYSKLNVRFCTHPLFSGQTIVAALLSPITPQSHRSGCF